MGVRITARTLDDLLWKLYPKLLASTNRPSPSKGATRELLGVFLELTNPLARLSRSETRGKPFSCLGEFLWYLSGDFQLDFIRYYLAKYPSDDPEIVPAGYGPRLFHQRGVDQVKSVIELLRNRPDSRRAVIQLFDAEDLISKRADVPCTCTLQFVNRSKRLHLSVAMRSNDAYIGLPHDVFSFTMLQEVLAKTLGLGLGRYYHLATSMHLYEDESIELAEQYLSEGVQASVAMPKMPAGNPWPALRNLQDAEARLREGHELKASHLETAPYWADLVRLLAIFAATGEDHRIDSLKDALTHDQYRIFAEARKGLKERKPVPPFQPSFDF